MTTAVSNINKENAKIAQNIEHLQIQFKKLTLNNNSKNTGTENWSLSYNIKRRKNESGTQTIVHARLGVPNGITGGIARGLENRMTLNVSRATTEYHVRSAHAIQYIRYLILCTA